MTALSNLDPTQAPTAKEVPRNNKREPRGLQKRPKHGGRIQLTSMNHLLESRPDGHGNPFMDIEIIVIGNSYPAASWL
jgi:hypothetical protein